MGKLFTDYALEEIQFQNGMFFKELALLYKENRELRDKDFKDGVGLAKIEACIEHYTNLKVAFNTDGEGPSIQVPDVNRNNPLVGEVMRHWLDSGDGLRMVNEAGGIVRGSVNLKTSKVGGVFTELTSILHFPEHMLRKDKFTPEEIAAITLHEIGHVFTYLEYLARSVTSNQVLAGIARVMDKTNTPEERQIVLASAKKALQLKDFDEKEAAKSTDKKVVETVVISALMRSSKDELGYDIYDANNWEFLSDQFAARHGAGRELAIALEKIYKNSYNISFRSTGTYYALEAAKLVVFACAAAGMVLYPGSLLALGSRFALGTVITAILIDGPGDPTYDRPGMRIRRIRNQVAENLKQGDLSADEKRRLQEDLKVLDEHLKAINDRLQFVSAVWTFISKDARTRIKTEELQRELESLATNDLFGKAEELKDLK